MTALPEITEHDLAFLRHLRLGVFESETTRYDRLVKVFAALHSGELRLVPTKEMKVLEDILATYLPNGVWQAADSILLKWRLGASPVDKTGETK